MIINKNRNFVHIFLPVRWVQGRQSAATDLEFRRRACELRAGESARSRPPRQRRELPRHCCCSSSAPREA